MLILKYPWWLKSLICGFSYFLYPLTMSPIELDTLLICKDMLLLLTFDFVLPITSISSAYPRIWLYLFSLIDAVWFQALRNNGWPADASIALTVTLALLTRLMMLFLWHLFLSLIQIFISSWWKVQMKAAALNYSAVMHSIPTLEHLVLFKFCGVFQRHWAVKWKTPPLKDFVHVRTRLPFLS